MLRILVVLSVIIAILSFHLFHSAVSASAAELSDELVSAAELSDIERVEDLLNQGVSVNAPLQFPA